MFIDNSTLGQLLGLKQKQFKFLKVIAEGHLKVRVYRGYGGSFNIFIPPSIYKQYERSLKAKNTEEQKNLENEARKILKPQQQLPKYEGQLAGFGILVGIMIIFYGLMMDTTVSTGGWGYSYRRVHNVGRMNQKTNIILVGGVILIASAVLLRGNQNTDQRG